MVHDEILSSSTVRSRWMRYLALALDYDGTPASDGKLSERLRRRSSACALRDGASYW
jgi:hypothetical protein